MNNSICGKYFYGNEVSEYGQENGYVDYLTLKRAFNAVLNNGILNATVNIGEWECVNGSEYDEETGCWREMFQLFILTITGLRFFGTGQMRLCYTTKSWTCMSGVYAISARHGIMC